jgi:hypothetical protein
MRGERSVRLSRHRRRFLLALSAVGLAAVALAGMRSGTAAAASCTDNFTGATGGDWSVAANWTSATVATVHAVPTAADVACWSAGTTVTVSTAGDTADSIQAGGDLIISGGSLNLAGSNGSSVKNLSIGGGELDGATGQTLTVTGNVAWSAGTVNAAAGNHLAIVQTGGGTFLASGNPSIGGGSITTTTAITLGTSTTVSGTGASFTVAGVNATGGSPQTYGFGSNALTLTGGTTTVAGGNTLTSGQVTLTGGTLQDDGTIGSSVTLTGGTLEGTGTGAGSVTNTSGIVSPGDGTGVGVLTVTGGYSQGAGGTLAIAINGTTPGSGFGRLNAGGAATLGGTLLLVGSLTPAPGSTFTVLNYASRSSGTFTLFGSGNYVPTYGPTAVTLSATPASCPGSNFDAYTVSTGDWSTGGNWSLGAPPAASQVACWDAGTTVTVGGGAETAASISAGGALNITGGTLTLVSGSAGSTVTDLALSAGKLNGTKGASLTVGGNFTWSGGAINASGGLAINQVGGGSFEFFGALSMGGGSIRTTSTMSITSTNLTASNAPKLTTTSTITLGSSATVSGTGATFTAAGVNGSGGTYGFGNHKLVLTGGTTTVARGDTLTGQLTLTGGTLAGTGSVGGSVTNSSGTVSPGDATGPGVLSITGAYTQGSLAKLAIELGGTTPGSGFSQLRVGGKTALGGALSLADDSGFIPTVGNTFLILSSPAGTPIGTFTLEGSGKGSYAATYDAQGVTLTVRLTPGNTVAPAITGTPRVGQTLSCSNGTWSANPTAFAYQWNRNGSPIAKAADRTYVVAAADLGYSLTCTVTASNAHGPGDPATSSPVLVPLPAPPPGAPASTSAPVVFGTPTPGNVLSCSNGTWSGGPTGFKYQWARNGSSIAGATHATYKVRIADEGSWLTCTVTALNGIGAGGPKTSAAIVVAKPGTLSCAKPTGRVSGASLGKLTLGFTRANARRALTRYTAATGNVDDFCIYGGWDIRAGYSRAHGKGTVVLALTVNPYYALDRARPGMRLKAVAKRLGVGKAIHLGGNDWYIVPGKLSAGVLRVRGGVIQEVGIATKRLTRGRGAQKRFLSRFKTA